ncbi:PQQ-dependent sugar dehydrogenase [Rhizomonospora bruguierae]|uniref:PQQ-dependent sugar dehydrogenase n=1 Tax=Rhizomonospora bruguierae TaxID=1581705 RepID=UPI001BCDB8B4|nr:PQQ-dependent sugar dehydrogenase [Micromonospora sp. NBRC 107566]
MSLSRRLIRGVAAAAVLAAAFTGVAVVVQRHRPVPAQAAPALPAGFREQVVLSGLDTPTNLEFASDGRIFVAEKRGVIKVFSGVGDTSPVVFADLRTEVFNGGDRGLLGLALAPTFPADPRVYVLYTRNADVGGTAPKYPDDKCANLYDGTCVVSGRLAVLEASGNTGTLTDVRLDGWCQQFPSHSIGELRFGPDGALYVTGGDGASYSSVDYGQSNACNDPPGGAKLTPPAAEGGALRAQDARTITDPTGYNGAVLRLDPGTLKPRADTPGTGDEAKRRIVAYGLRNPYRMALRPAAGGKAAELWMGDVGWNTVEEINRFAVPPTTVTNFGWPCYEGPGRQAGYDGADLTICENLYKANAVTAPYFSYRHADQVRAGDICPSGGSSVSGLAFYPGGPSTYPAEYRNSLFFADYARQCIWAMLPGADGTPSPARISTFAAAARPVDLEIGPDTLLYYVDLDGTVRRFRYFAGNQPPIAAFSATPVSGAPPLKVAFDAGSSVDPDAADQNLLTYEWDFDYTPGGAFGVDATGRTATHVYAEQGVHHAALRVRDGAGLPDIAVRDIDVAAGKPTAVIDSPVPTDTWATGQTITFSGRGVDDKDGTLPASALTWQLVLHHCYPGGACHQHPAEEFIGVSSGSFVAPDHEYPAFLELRLTVTDSDGQQSASSVQISPRTVNVTVTADPAGSPLTFGGETLPTPFMRTVIVGTSITVSAPTTLTLVDGRVRRFVDWSDGGAPTHTIVAPEADTVVTATYHECRGTYGRACADIPRPDPGTPPR